MKVQALVESYLADLNHLQETLRWEGAQTPYSLALTYAVAYPEIAGLYNACLESAGVAYSQAQQAQADRYVALLRES